MDDPSARKLKRYDKAFARHGQSPKALYWTDYKSAAVRYKQLVADTDFEGKSILDAGCGMGDLLPYIHAKTEVFDYLGVDTSENFVETARKRYEGHNFEVANPFSDDFKHSFDVVISSGVMNANRLDWLEARKAMITRLWSLSRQTLIFNMAGGFGSQPDRTETHLVVYAPAEEILEFCKTLTDKVTIRADYHPRDFTIVMSR